MAGAGKGREGEGGGRRRRTEEAVVSARTMASALVGRCKYVRRALAQRLSYNLRRPIPPSFLSLPPPPSSPLLLHLVLPAEHAARSPQPASRNARAICPLVAPSRFRLAGLLSQSDAGTGTHHICRPPQPSLATSRKITMQALCLTSPPQAVSQYYTALHVLCLLLSTPNLVSL